MMKVDHNVPSYAVNIYDICYTSHNEQWTAYPLTVHDDCPGQVRNKTRLSPCDEKNTYGSGQTNITFTVITGVHVNFSERYHILSPSSE